MSTKRLRVVTLIDQLVLAGGELLAAQIAMALDPARFDSTVCVTRPSEPHRISDVEASGVRVLLLDRRSKLDVVRWRPFVKLLRDERVDVLHAHKHGSNVWAASLGRLAGVPVVVAHEHSWTYVGQPFRELLDRWLVARSADVFLGTSPEHWRRMVEGRRIDPARARYVLNAAPPLRQGDRAATRRELGISEAAPVIGTVCGLRPEKAVEVIIEAAAALVADFPQLKVVIAGDGPERARLEELVERLGLSDTVLFLGWQPRETLPGILAALDIGVLSSDFEASPLSLIEFLGAGKPVVATKVGGVPALVEDGREGLLVPPRDPASFARAVATLLGDHARLAAFGEQARERHHRDYRFELMVRRIEGLYESLYWSSERGRREAAGPRSSSGSRLLQ
jgi:glycosyltransferase involved in cell wall biosynthesis